MIQIVLGIRARLRMHRRIPTPVCGDLDCAPISARDPPVAEPAIAALPEAAR